MPMHDEFLQYVRALARGEARPASRPPRKDPFALLPEKLRMSIVKNIFLDKYPSNSSTPLRITNFDKLASEDPDGLFDWMKERLQVLEYEYDTKSDGISYWEYDACYDEITDIFFFSPVMASTALKVFIQSHTRRMSAKHLPSKDLPFFYMAKFPESQLRHLSVYIDAGTGKASDSTRFDDLIRAIPDLHLTLTGLKSLKVEIISKPQDADRASLMYAQHASPDLEKLEKLALMLSFAIKRFPRVAMRFKEQMVFSGDWDVDKQVLAETFRPAHSMTSRPAADSSPVALRWPLGSKFGPKVRW